MIPGLGNLGLTALLCSPQELAAIGVKHVPYALVTNRQAIEMVTLPHAPGRLFSFGAFECRLNGDPRVDFMVCAMASDGARSASNQVCTGGGLIATWQSESSSGADDTGGIWIEWDHRSASEWRPFVFVRAADEREPGRWTRERFGAWLDWISCHSLPERLDPALRSRVLELHARLPSGATVLHLAALAPRGLAAVRMHVSLDRAQLRAFSSELGWKECPRLEQALAALEELPDPIGIQVDVGQAGIDFIDLEVYLDSAPASDARWKGALDWMSTLQGCDPAKIAVASSWPDNVAIGDRGAILIRRVSFKVRLLRDGSTVCKAYLGFSPRWLSGSERYETSQPEVDVGDAAVL